MIHARMEIVLLDDDAASAKRYQSAFEKAGLRVFKVAHLPARRIIAEPGYDALYWTLTAAEHWNVRPVEDVIQIVRTTVDDRHEGWPDYLLVGLTLSPQNAICTERGLRAWAQALFAALAGDSAAAIFRVKVPIDMIALKQLSATSAATVLAEAERGLA